MQGAGLFIERLIFHLQLVKVHQVKATRQLVLELQCMFKLAKLAFELSASDADSLHFLCCVPLILLELHVFTHGYIMNRLININSLSLTLKDATMCSITYTIVCISLQQVISQILLDLSDFSSIKHSRLQ